MEKIDRNKRIYNIELLRILSMIFVVLFHINLNVILRNPETSLTLKYYAIISNALFACAVNCFILISGFFGIKYKLKSFLGLFFQTEFYSVLALLIAIFLLDYNFKIPSGLLPFHPSGLWFIPIYVLLYLLSPILNQLILSKTLHKYCILCFVIFQFAGYYGMGYEGYNITNFILLYLIGRWLKLYPIVITTKRITCYLFLSLIYTVLINVIGVNQGMPISTKFFWAYCSPQILLSSSLIFLFFTKIKIQQTLFMKVMASGSLSVYLVHENSLINKYIYI